MTGFPYLGYGNASGVDVLREGLARIAEAFPAKHPCREEIAEYLKMLHVHDSRGGYLRHVARQICVDMTKRETAWLANAKKFAGDVLNGIDDLSAKSPGKGYCDVLNACLLYKDLVAAWRSQNMKEVY